MRRIGTWLVVVVATGGLSVGGATAAWAEGGAVPAPHISFGGIGHLAPAPHISGARFVPTPHISMGRLVPAPHLSFGLAPTPSGVPQPGDLAAGWDGVLSVGAALGWFPVR